MYNKEVWRTAPVTKAVLQAVLLLAFLASSSAWSLASARTNHPTGPAFGQITLQEAIAMANEDYHRAGAREWFGAMVEGFSSSMDAVEQSCWPGETGEAGGAFTFVLRLSAAGTIVQTLVDHETPLSGCVIDGMSAMRFPPPVKDNFWILVYLDFTGNDADE